MNICMPVTENRKYESVAHNHFGSAPLFLIFDTDNNTIKIIDNGDKDHEHGKCQPLKAIQDEEIDVVLVGGIGAGAINKLNNQGVKVFRVVEGNAEFNINLFKEGKLEEFSSNSSCNHNGCGGH